MAGLFRQHAIQPHDDVLVWLLEPLNPCVRWRTLREWLGRPDDDREVRDAAAAVYAWPPIARVLEMAADPGSFAWPEGVRLTAAPPGRDLAVLARVGVPPGRPALRAGAEALRQWVPDSRSSSCYLPQFVAAFLRYGDPADPEVLRLVERVVANEVLADGDRPPTGGGGGCCGTHSCHNAAVRALDCVSLVPEGARTASMRDFLRRGAAYLESHRLFQRNRHRFAPIRSQYTRLHQPWALDWLTDVLDLLDIATRLALSQSPSLAPALRLLLDKQRPDGRWDLEVVYHTNRPLVANLLSGLEEAGAPGRWVTLTALLLLRRCEGLVRRIREGEEFAAPVPDPVASFAPYPREDAAADRAQLREVWAKLPGMTGVLEGLEAFAREHGLQTGWYRGLAVGPAACREWCVSYARLVPSRAMRAAFPVARTVFLAPRGMFTADGLAERLQIGKMHAHSRPVRPGSWVEKALWRLKVEPWTARWDAVGIAIREAGELSGVTQVMSEALQAAADRGGWTPG